MQKTVSLKLLPSEAADDSIIKNYIAQELSTTKNKVSGFIILKHSIDARSRQIWVNISVQAFIDEPFQHRNLLQFNFRDVTNSKYKILIAGAGPAGLFAALKLLESGIKPIILERGKDVKARRRDLAVLNKSGIVNPESNYCYGEGGAGTYSDGKLYTRSSKRGDVNRILNLFFHFGASENILFESHPHIGTNKLPDIITAIRKKILDCGGEIHFEKKITDLIIKNEKVTGVKATDVVIEGNAVILATGHSARDIFELLHSKNILIEFKPFALGVRAEHPQTLIDTAQYHCTIREASLPPASYSLVEQVEGKGVFSFCMCPGGIIAPAATSPGEVVVNGWSPSKRNNPFANSGIVISVEEKDLYPYKKYGVLGGMFFQKEVEQKAFHSGGGYLVAPAQRLVDFTENKLSTSLPQCSYLPGIHSVSLNEVLPEFIHKRLSLALREFGKKIKGYFTNEAVLVATESRTSSPIRIPRNEETLQHPQLENLYPCGEGAGYAGGIVSSAMDGEKVAAMIIKKVLNQ
ncbi:MAG: FAD-dependent monooxygenase [Bacteroidetes bacterium]|nr:FAD-dependent monooxygenase [Bacteroidota bacterium]MBS1631143.1 FAD-dependent monooxygenase [Bacteroidota bacterium]